MYLDVVVLFFLCVKLVEVLYRKRQRCKDEPELQYEGTSSEASSQSPSVKRQLSPSEREHLRLLQVKNKKKSKQGNDTKKLAMRLSILEYLLAKQQQQQQQQQQQPEQKQQYKRRMEEKKPKQAMDAQRLHPKEQSLAIPPQNHSKEEQKDISPNDLIPLNKTDLKHKVDHLERQLFCVMHRFKEIEREVMDLKGSESYLKDEITIFMSENEELQNKVLKYKDEGAKRFNRDKEMLKGLNELARFLRNNNDTNSNNNNNNNKNNNTNNNNNNATNSNHKNNNNNESAINNNKSNNYEKTKMDIPNSSTMPRSSNTYEVISSGRCDIIIGSSSSTSTCHGGGSYESIIDHLRFNLEESIIEHMQSEELNSHGTD